MRAIFDSAGSELEALLVHPLDDGNDLVYPVSASIAFGGAIAFDIVFESLEDMADKVEQRLNEAMTAIGREIIPRGGFNMSLAFNIIVLGFEFEDTGALYGDITITVHMPVRQSTLIH